MNGITLEHAASPTPKVGPRWLVETALERRQRVTEACKSFPVEVMQAAANGEIRLMLTTDLRAQERGGLLLDIEAHLKHSVDPGLHVWLEAMGDRNSLRNLRGIDVKSKAVSL